MYDYIPLAYCLQVPNIYVRVFCLNLFLFFNLLFLDTFLHVGWRVFECIFLGIGMITAWIGNGAAMYAVHQTRRHDPVLGTYAAK